jgi:predicted glycogen debranching enzyme
VTNGLGGYASGAVDGLPTRRYHGLLIASLPAPLGRRMMLNDLVESLRTQDGTEVRLDTTHRGKEATPQPNGTSESHFRLDLSLPVWHHRAGPVAFEKCVFLPEGRNTVLVRYRLLEGRPIRLTLRPAVHFRSHANPVSDFPGPVSYRLSVEEGRYEVHGDKAEPPLRLRPVGAKVNFIRKPQLVRDRIYRVEEFRGYEAAGELWCPGQFVFDVEPGGELTLIASSEEWKDVLALDPAEAWRAERDRRKRLIEAADPKARGGRGADLVLAADQFLVMPAGRAASAETEHPRSVIAGYHWFTDWGRDTMISLEGLTLCTDRVKEAGRILRTFAGSIRDGLIPNLFPEGKREGLYHTADATLWYFHALDRYLRASGDEDTLGQLLPALLEVVEHHRKGTRFNIGVDPADGLLRQGTPDLPLTWMDAKVGDWVVTPRRGKAVEINALWYNALRLLEGWTRAAGRREDADRLAGYAALAERSFNQRFWNEAGGCLYDVVDGEGGDDASFRPNQVFAISLPHPVLRRERWEPVLRAVKERLLTPVGLRTLSPDDPRYQPVYFGERRSRDAAYHQGTVWPWLLGPFVDAWLKLYPDRKAEARGFLKGLLADLDQSGVGSLSEIFDAHEPHRARGCIAQAWSVAEALRAWINTAGS